MIVVDASALVAALMPGLPGDCVRRRILDNGGSLHAPELVDLETLQALRKNEQDGRLSPEAADRGFRALRALRLTRYPHRLLALRVWDLRTNLSAYDAAYVALAEALDAPLLTFDRALARVPGVHARIEIAG